VFPIRDEKEKGEGFGEMIKAEIDMWCGRGPIARNFVRNASARSAVHQSCRETKSKNGPWISPALLLSTFVCHFLVLFRASNGQKIIPEESALNIETPYVALRIPPTLSYPVGNLQLVDIFYFSISRPGLAADNPTLNVLDALPLWLGSL
jgi:hypothetical protein